eukprot:TRINITY_DN64012_c0_g1_i1.p1 TRINITY_DN64012_c0_g1~~TRINITY_DN64012_c0_g1_i1.p1  ORF type:complete len:258 (-),score=23.33 TRINITY_DN64012_c0_g1_i1:207-908(-)
MPPMPSPSELSVHTAPMPQGLGRAPVKINKRTGLAMSPDDLVRPDDVKVRTQLLRSDEAGLLPATVHTQVRTSLPTEPLRVTTAAESEFEHLVDDVNLPDAHQMYHYGHRQVGFADRVPMPQQNNGVAIVTDYRGYPQHIGHAIVHYDEAIGNEGWNHIGPMLRIHDGNFWCDTSGRESKSSENLERLRGADFRQAVDMRGLKDMASKRRGATASMRTAPNFQRLQKLRTGAM